MKIAGFGKAKAEKYGDEILEAIEGYCSRRGLASNMDAKPGNPLKEKTKTKNSEAKIDTKTVSYNFFKQGLAVNDIAVERKLSAGTIESHLCHFVGLGKIHIDEMVPLAKQELIKQAVKIHGALSHKTLIENLPESITYNNIRMVLAAGKINQTG